MQNNDRKWYRNNNALEKKNEHSKTVKIGKRSLKIETEGQKIICDKTEPAQKKSKVSDGVFNLAEQNISTTILNSNTKRNSFNSKIFTKTNQMLQDSPNKPKRCLRSGLVLNDISFSEESKKISCDQPQKILNYEVKDEKKSIPRRKKLRSEVKDDELWEGILQFRFKRLFPLQKKIEQNHSDTQKEATKNVDNDLCPVPKKTFADLYEEFLKNTENVKHTSISRKVNKINSGCLHLSSSDTKHCFSPRPICSISDSSLTEKVKNVIPEDRKSILFLKNGIETFSKDTTDMEGFQEQQVNNSNASIKDIIMKQNESEQRGEHCRTIDEDKKLEAESVQFTPKRSARLQAKRASSSKKENDFIYTPLKRQDVTSNAKKCVKSLLAKYDNMQKYQNCADKFVEGDILQSKLSKHENALTGAKEDENKINNSYKSAKPKENHPEFIENSNNTIHYNEKSNIKEVENRMSETDKMQCLVAKRNVERTQQQNTTTIYEKYQPIEISIERSKQIDINEGIFVSKTSQSPYTESVTGETGKNNDKITDHRLFEHNYNKTEEIFLSVPDTATFDKCYKTGEYEGKIRSQSPETRKIKKHVINAGNPDESHNEHIVYDTPIKQGNDHIFDSDIVTQKEVSPQNNKSACINDLHDHASFNFVANELNSLIKVDTFDACCHKNTNNAADEQNNERNENEIDSGSIGRRSNFVPGDVSAKDKENERTIETAMIFNTLHVSPNKLKFNTTGKDSQSFPPELCSSTGIRSPIIPHGLHKYMGQNCLLHHQDNEENNGSTQTDTDYLENESKTIFVAPQQHAKVDIAVQNDAYNCKMNQTQISTSQIHDAKKYFSNDVNLKKIVMKPPMEVCGLTRNSQETTIINVDENVVSMPVDKGVSNKRHLNIIQDSSKGKRKKMKKASSIHTSHTIQNVPNSKTDKDTTISDDSVGTTINTSNVIDRTPETHTEEKEIEKITPRQSSKSETNDENQSVSHLLRMKIKKTEIGAQIVSHSMQLSDNPVVVLPRLSISKSDNCEKDSRASDFPRKQERSAIKCEVKKESKKKQTRSRTRSGEGEIAVGMDDPDAELKIPRRKGKVHPSQIKDESIKRKSSKTPDSVKTNDRSTQKLSGCTEESEILSNCVLGKHASVLWSSENRRHYQQIHSKSDASQVEELMRAAWETLPRKEKLKYYHRAYHATRDDNKHSTPKKQNKNSEDEPKPNGFMVKFLALNPCQQYEELKRRLRHIADVSQEEYNKLMQDFKQELQTIKQKNSKEGDMQVLYRNTMFRKILDIWDTIASIYRQKRDEMKEKFQQDYREISRKLVLGQDVQFSKTCRSDKLGELLLDIHELEKNNKISVCGELLSCDRYEAILDDLLECEFSTDDWSPLCDIRVPDLSSSVLSQSKSNHLPELDVKDVEKELDSLLPSESITPDILCQLSTYFDDSAKQIHYLLRKNPGSVCCELNSPSCILNSWLISDQFNALSRGKMTKKDMFIDPRYLNFVLQNSHASQGFETQIERNPKPVHKYHDTNSSFGNFSSFLKESNYSSNAIPVNYGTETLHDKIESNLTSRNTRRNPNLLKHSTVRFTSSAF